jgi:hypothetical protein
MLHLFCDLAQQIGRSIRRIVINKNRLPTKTSKSDLETIKQRPDIVALVEGRNYNG